MKKLWRCMAVVGLVFTGALAEAAEPSPAPAEKGLADGGPQVVAQTKEDSTEAESPESKSDASKQNEATASEQKPAPGVNNAADHTEELRAQIAALQKEIDLLRKSLETTSETKKELDRLRGRVVILEGDNATLAEKLQAATQKFDELFPDGQSRRTTAKPAYVKAAVRFHNWEDRTLKMNVNGVWHTLLKGENTIWVPYGPVQIYRYSEAEPKAFSGWKSHFDGFLMEFDVGTPPKG